MVGTEASKLKVLACACAARPGAGSENFVGWQGLLALSSRYDVTAIVHSKNREEIEAASAQLQGHSLRWVFVGQPHSWHPNRLIARFQDWFYVARWIKEAHRTAKALVSKEKFDLAHHLTVATWRLPSPLGGLDLPLIWGPVGGGEVFPPTFYSILSPTAALFERVRAFSNTCGKMSWQMRLFAKRVSIALGNNPETLAVLQHLGLPAERTLYLSQSFLPPDKILSAEKIQAKAERQVRRTPRETLRIFAGGNLEGRKGVAIALRALERFGQMGNAFEFVYGGLGPELGFLQKKIDQMNFGLGKVILGRHLSGEEYRAALEDADIYLLPSLREGAPVTMIEAMACGCVPIVANAGGAPMVVNSNCGFVIPVSNPDDMTQAILDRLVEINENSSELSQKAMACWRRVVEVCRVEAYLEVIDKAYQAALDCQAASNPKKHRA